MKTKIITMVAAAFVAILFTSSLMAEEDGKPNKRLSRDEMRAKILEQFDADGDGKLSPEERATAKETMQKKRGEREGKGKGKGNKGDRPKRMTKEEMLEKFDKNGDGKLDEKERAVAKEEMKKMRGKRGGKDGQKRMTREEFVKKFDKNGDGKLDGKERAAAREEMRKMRGNRERGKGQGDKRRGGSQKKRGDGQKKRR